MERLEYDHLFRWFASIGIKIARKPSKRREVIETIFGG